MDMNFKDKIYAGRLYNFLINNNFSVIEEQDEAIYLGIAFIVNGREEELRQIYTVLISKYNSNSPEAFAAVYSGYKRNNEMLLYNQQDIVNNLFSNAKREGMIISLIQRILDNQYDLTRIFTLDDINSKDYNSYFNSIEYAYNKLENKKLKEKAINRPIAGRLMTL